MTSKNAAAKARRVAKRDELWPEAPNLVFDPDNRKLKGYAPVPRVVPLLASLIDQAKRESSGSLYQVLWAHNWGQGIIEVGNKGGFLFEAGYRGAQNRIERTWKERIKILEEHGLIRTAPKGLDRSGYILLVDPYLAGLALVGSGRADQIDAQWSTHFRLFAEDWGIDLDSYRERLSNLGSASEEIL